MSANDLGASTITGTLTVNANGEITQSGLLDVTGTSSFTAGAANNIMLANASNDFSTVIFGSGNDVNITDANDLDLGTSTISGDLTVVTSGLISQSGTLTVNSTNKTATFSAGSANDIILSNNNDFTSVAIQSGEDVTLNDINALKLGQSIISGHFTVTTAGALTQNGSILANVVAKTTTLNAGSTGIII